MPPSCASGGAGLTNCGPTNESCCTSLEVPTGSFYRSYDGLSLGYTSTAYPATVSGFRLDKYEVTVGRFRQFVAAVVCGWLPAAGSGKHVHLNGGNGLSATGGGYETGWDVTWDSNLPTTTSGWNSSLTGGTSPSTGSTWTATAGSSESLPVTEANWYAAYAFCIWDGGFLPSEAEWNYAATGGSDQRVYPWSPAYPPGSTSISCADANYVECPAGTANVVGSDSPTGDGKWGQSDLAGNAWEWNLDGFAGYATPCADCASLTAISNRVFRSGDFLGGEVLASYRNSGPPQDNWDLIGVRCARSP